MAKNEYILIFRHQDGVEVATPEQIKIWMDQTYAWIGSIAAKDGFVGGNGLSFSESRVVHADKTVTTGPFGKIQETIGGYIIVRAENAEEAAEFAKGSPVLQGTGNTIEVRRIAHHE